MELNVSIQVSQIKVRIFVCRAEVEAFLTHLAVEGNVSASTLGYGEAYLPDALDRKYPKAGREWIWQYVFPARQRSVDPRSGVVRRHHLDDSYPSSVTLRFLL